MLRQVLDIALRGEVEYVRRRARRAAFGGGILLLLLLAFVFAVVSFYLWLATHYAPWVAALIVVAMLLVAALILWAAGRIASRSTARRRAEHQMQTALDAAFATTKKDDGALVAMAAVLAVGFLVGRGMSK